MIKLLSSLNKRTRDSFMSFLSNRGGNYELTDRYNTNGCSFSLVNREVVEKYDSIGHRNRNFIVTNIFNFYSDGRVVRRRAEYRSGVRLKVNTHRRSNYTISKSSGNSDINTSVSNFLKFVQQNW